MYKLLKKLAIVRTSISHQSITHYNSQELGLALELSKKEILIDIFYASNRNEIVNVNDYVRIIYLTTISFYKQQGLLKNINSYLLKGQYDLIQIAEESMLQSVLISKYAKELNTPVVLLQGMYESHSGLIKQIIQRTYNFILLPILRKNIQLAICKTTSAQNYLYNLNFKNTKVIPVGFNSSIINSEVTPDKELENIDASKKIILYIGKIEKRRNPDFILELAKAYENNENIIFVCVGNGELEEEFVGKKGKNVLHFNKIKQNQLQFLYDKASLFLMPTNYEIFGMVYLECMHFGVPVITTLNAGSMDLFENNYDSFIVDSLNLKEWIEKIDHIINSNIGADFSQRLKKKSSKYDWSTISDTYLREYQNVVSLFNK
tara:strand:- start:6579 stop:7706 length:1128 start_codon:yes stop_codon:yes gene_type:complete